MIQFKHKCPECERYHPCNPWNEKHLIDCPISKTEYEVLVGRQGRQINAIPISKRLRK